MEFLCTNGVPRVVYPSTEVMVGGELVELDRAAVQIVLVSVLVGGYSEVLEEAVELQALGSL